MTSNFEYVKIELLALLFYPRSYWDQKENLFFIKWNKYKMFWSIKLKKKGLLKIKFDQFVDLW